MSDKKTKMNDFKISQTRIDLKIAFSNYNNIQISLKFSIFYNDHASLKKENKKRRTQ